MFPLLETRTVKTKKPAAGAGLIVDQEFLKSIIPAGAPYPPHWVGVGLVLG